MHARNNETTNCLKLTFLGRICVYLCIILVYFNLNWNFCVNEKKESQFLILKFAKKVPTSNALIITHITQKCQKKFKKSSILMKLMKNFFVDNSGQF